MNSYIQFESDKVTEVNQIQTKSFEWWEQRARHPSILTNVESEVINNCGGLSYIRNILEKEGVLDLIYSIISNKHYAECGSDCVCQK